MSSLLLAQVTCDRHPLDRVEIENTSDVKPQMSAIVYMDTMRKKSYIVYIYKSHHLRQTIYFQTAPESS